MERTLVPRRHQLVLAGALVSLLFAPDALATHFRYGHLTWRPRQDLSQRMIEFTLVAAFRRNGYPGTAPDGRAAVGDQIDETIGDTSLNFGDGTSVTGRLHFKVTAIDVERNWIFALAHLPSQPELTTIRHLYANDGTYLAFIDTCCRISPCLAPNRHINNPDGRYRVQTRVTVGTGNRPPVSTLVPIVGFRRNTVNSIQIPFSDPDGDAVRFRLSTASEAAGSGTFRQPGFGGSGAPIPCSVSPTGLFTWDTTGASISDNPSCTHTLYSTQVIMEDLAIDGTSKSQVALDFFIQIAGRGAAPVFEPPTPCEQTIFVQARTPVSFVVRATDPDGDPVQLNALGLPTNATMTPGLPESGNPIEAVFNWNPAVSQVGTHVVSFVANDDFAQSHCQVVISVSACENVVTFDQDAAGRAIGAGVDVSGAFLLDQGVRLDGQSRDTDSPGVFTLQQGAPGSETDDLVPVSGLNYVTTLRSPRDFSHSDYGSICVNFVDPTTHEPRTVEYAEIWFLDVEDSVGTIRAFDGPNCTGEVILRSRIEGQGDRSQTRSSVGAIGSGARIASMRVEFGDVTDSAALDSLCFQFTASAVGLEDGLEPDAIVEIPPGGSAEIVLSASNGSPDRFPASYVLFLMRTPDDPDRHPLKPVRRQDLVLPSGGPFSKTMLLRVPQSFGERHLGETYRLCHVLCTRDGFVEAVESERILIGP